MSGVADRYEIAIEILDAAFPASSWQRAWGDALTTSAMEWSGLDWQWREFTWGLLFMVAFPTEAEYEEWRRLPAVIAALDAVPDPVSGLIFHRGWGGTSGSGEPRRGKPLTGAGGAEVPEPVEEIPDDAVADAVRHAVGAGDVRTAASA
jgi:hypothetical protein